MLKEEGQLRAEIAGLVEEAEAVDAAEDAHYGEDVRGDERPEELKRREDRLAAIRAAKARLDAEEAGEGRSVGPQAGAEAQPEGRQARGFTVEANLGRPLLSAHSEPRKPQP